MSQLITTNDASQAVAGSTIASVDDVLTMIGQTSGTVTAADLALINLIVPGSDWVLKDFLNSTLQYSQHTEILPAGPDQYPRNDLVDYDVVGNRLTVASRHSMQRVLQLRHTPVSTAVPPTCFMDLAANAGTAPGAFPASSQLVYGSDFWLDIDSNDDSVSRTGLLWHVSSWPVENRTCLITYWAGWGVDQLNSQIAGNIKMAAIKLAVHFYWTEKANQRFAGGAVASEAIGKYSTSAGWLAQNRAAAIPVEIQDMLQSARCYGRLMG